MKKIKVKSDVAKSHIVGGGMLQYGETGTVSARTGEPRVPSIQTRERSRSLDWADHHRYPYRAHDMVSGKRGEDIKDWQKLDGRSWMAEAGWQKLDAICDFVKSRLVYSLQILRCTARARKLDRALEALG